MNNWLSSTIKFLETQNYQEVINIYENLLKNNPDEITYYWYLGLAYLLNQQETEAQTTWFIPFSQGNEQQCNLWMEELTQILTTEAILQEHKKNYDLVWLIGNALREMNPNNLVNLLSLLQLSVIIDKFESNFITDWHISEILEGENHPVISIELLANTLDKVLKFPVSENIGLAKSCLIYTNNNNLIFDKIRNVAYSMGNEKLYIFYAITLLEMCQEIHPNNINPYCDLHIFYSYISKYNEAIEIAKELKKLMEKKSEIEGKILASNLLHISYMTLGKWQEASDIEKEQQRNWLIFIEEKPTINEPILKQGFIASLMTSLYIRDDLVYHRNLFNEVSSLYQFYNKDNELVINHHKNKENRPLKIGYIGHTFRCHSVGYLCRWLLHYHNRESFELYIYSVQGHEDEITEKWFKNKVTKFFQGQRNANDIVMNIINDEIDILVDLDSATSNVTNLVLCQKPAPIQITWLGLDASGLPSIDYYIADPYVLPDYAEKYYREKIWRFPHTYLAIDGFEMATPTRRREDLGLSNDDVIFMNLQNPAKLNPDILTSQLKIVNAVPNGYLFTKIRKDEEALKKLVTEIAKSQNVSCDKLRFIPSDIEIKTHRANLQIADVILDTYPYNGSTTTLEALWAEIPVVTRVGEQFAARNSYTYMVNAGITEGIAWSEEEYISWGIKFGTDENLRKEVSWKLRQSKKTSPLWNAKQFTREMEKAYQQMWQIYLEENK
ncbi:O-linked N-acetylglucosamine transferase, SPINDLY family protein [Geminocystis sp. CENA526]|uniref:O-linked N-acetylglucosamine transferase, SPINDLY family protein n=1 Tax=Geminocystis sp. CENA526 TaxID=1355871 RepID=UPI003D6DF7C5